MQRYVPNVTARTRMPPALTASPLGGVLWAQMGGGVLWPSLLPSQFCSCKKRSLLCCAIGCQCLRRLCYRGSNDPKAGGRRQQAEASSLRQCLATIPSRTLGSMGGWDYLLAGEKPKSRVGRKWRAVGGLPLFEIQGWRLLALFVRTRLVLPSNRYR